MPCHCHLDEKSATRKEVMGVPYDSGRYPLAPTKDERQNEVASFLVDERLMLTQAGDMMSKFHTWVMMQLSISTTFCNLLINQAADSIDKTRD